MIQKSGSSDREHLAVSAPITYSEVAAHLRKLADEVKSPEAREQLAVLAALYEKLAVKSARLSDVYLP